VSTKNKNKTKTTTKKPKPNLVEKDLALDDAGERAETALVNAHRLLVQLEGFLFLAAKDCVVRQLGEVHGL
jgi:hypothetical protein